MINSTSNSTALNRVATRAIALTAVLAFGLGACGSDDGGGGAQGELADKVVAQIDGFNTDGEIDVDEACVRDAISKMSDAAAQDALANLDEPDYEGFDVVGEQIEADCFSEA